ncbi:hypothetical protein Ddc_16530 [Ditylenchus destructor]|nr:hypothetical protein Ddc_16530 [Ditylenchus destructor]
MGYATCVTLEQLPPLEASETVAREEIIFECVISLLKRGMGMKCLSDCVPELAGSPASLGKLKVEAKFTLERRVQFVAYNGKISVADYTSFQLSKASTAEKIGRMRLKGLPKVSSEALADMSWVRCLLGWLKPMPCSGTQFSIAHSSYLFSFIINPEPRGLLRGFRSPPLPPDLVVANRR